MRDSTIVVTGASGFVGSKLVHYLADKNYFIYAISYDSSNNSIDMRSNIAYVKSNYRDILFLSRIISLTSCVVHLAGRAHHTNEENHNLHDLYYSANVLPIKNILIAASNHPKLKIIYLSSISVYGKLKGFISLNDPTTPSTPYGFSKLDAERAILSATNTKISYTILRSPLIFGLDAPGNFKKLILLAKYSPLLPFANLTKKKSMIHIISVLEVILFSILKESTTNKIYLIAEPTSFSTSEILSSLLVYHHRSPNVLFKFPVQLLYFIAKYLGLKDTFSKLSEQVEIDPCSLYDAHTMVTRPLSDYYSIE